MKAFEQCAMSSVRALQMPGIVIVISIFFVAIVIVLVIT